MIVANVPVETWPRRSLTVSALAWFGLLGGLGTVAVGWAALKIGFSLTNIGALAGGLVAISASWGLWRRREWARQSFIGVQIYGLAFVIARVLFPGLIYRSIRFPPNLPPEIHDMALRNARSAAVFAMVPAVLIGGFVIYKLTSRRVREEFAASPE